MKFIQMMIASSDPPFYVELNSATATSTLSVRPAGFSQIMLGLDTRSTSTCDACRIKTVVTRIK
ncbi:MAG: hypothetical protein WAU25_01615, partial [Nitrososphaeraceae archaeon]